MPCDLPAMGQIVLTELSEVSRMRGRNDQPGQTRKRPIAGRKSARRSKRLVATPVSTLAVIAAAAPAVPEAGIATSAVETQPWPCMRGRRPERDPRGPRPQLVTSDEVTTRRSDERSDDVTMCLHGLSSSDSGRSRNVSRGVKELAPLDA
jgi:hypothetical protein